MSKRVNARPMPPRSGCILTLTLSHSLTHSLPLTHSLTHSISLTLPLSHSHSRSRFLQGLRFAAARLQMRAMPVSMAGSFLIFMSLFSGVRNLLASKVGCHS